MSVPSSLAEPQLNATPLIDVMLVLVVMLIITLPVATHAVKLNLPQRADGTPPPSVVLDIDFQGALFWNGQPLASLDELLPRLAALGKNSNAPALSVVPEKRAPYERVAQVLAAAQRARVLKMSVAPVADR